MNWFERAGHALMRDSVTRNNSKLVSRDLNRRDLFSVTGNSIALLACPYVIIRALGARPVWADGNPFSLGVAAGDPSPDGFVLWTRLE